MILFYFQCNLSLPECGTKSPMNVSHCLLSWFCIDIVIYSCSCYLFVLFVFLFFFVFFLLFSLQTPKDSTLVFLLMYIVSSCSFTSDTIPHRSTSTSITIDSERTRVLTQPLVTTLLCT